jgi:hypothetical protein
LTEAAGVGNFTTAEAAAPGSVKIPFCFVHLHLHALKGDWFDPIEAGVRDLVRYQVVLPNHRV